MHAKGPCNYAGDSDSPDISPYMYSPSRYVSYNKQLKKYEHEQQQQQ